MQGCLSLIMCVVTFAATASARAAELPPELEPQVRDMVQTAEAAGLPGERLLTKANEGLAKGVPAPRILTVLSQLRLRLDEAASIVDAMQPKQQPAKDNRRRLVGTVADALHAGVPAGALRKIGAAGLARRAADVAPVNGAIAALTDLVIRGYPVEAAGEVIEAALAHGLGEGDFPGLVQAIRGLGGADLGEALRSVRAVLDTMPALDWMHTRGIGPRSGSPSSVGTAQPPPVPVNVPDRSREPRR